MIVYRKGDVRELPSDRLAGLDGFNRWVSVLNPEKDELENIYRTFEIHPLVREDIGNTRELPKVDEYAKYTFIVTDIPVVEENGVVMHKLSLILGNDFLISITDQSALIREIETKLMGGADSMDDFGPDYLAYSLIDRAVDAFYPVLDDMEDTVSEIEEETLENVDKAMFARMKTVRKGMLTLRKSAWQIRNVIMEMSRGSSKFITPATLVYVRDIYDHVTQAMDLIETYREILMSSRDVYMSAVSLSLNQVMKQLTIISTIMLPLTFIVGVYGMNFVHMPELEWEYGYYAVWAVIILITVCMLAYFRIKKWI